MKFVSDMFHPNGTSEVVLIAVFGLICTINRKLWTSISISSLIGGYEIICLQCTQMDEFVFQSSMPLVMTQWAMRQVQRDGVQCNL